MPYEGGRALIEELNALAVHRDLAVRAPLEGPREFDRVGTTVCPAPRPPPYGTPPRRGRVIRRCHRARGTFQPMKNIGVLPPRFREYGGSCRAATRRSWSAARRAILR
jgi:hypothetical protein